MRYSFALSASLSLSILALAPNSAVAGPVKFYSWSFSQTFGFPGEEQNDFRPDGVTSSASVSVVTASSLEEGSASADLISGQVRALSHSRAAVGSFGASVETLAFIGDSFRTFDGSNPFAWNDSVATMTLDLSGVVSTTGTDKYNYSFLYFFVFTPGTLDAVARGQGENNDALLESAFANTLYSATYQLGPTGSFAPDDGVTFLESYPQELVLTFEPHGDFDWAMGLELTTSAGVGAESLADFSHTLGATYSAPAGTTTLSASGVFPGTLPLVESADPIPEPSSLILLATGLAGVVRSRVRSPRGLN